MPDEKHRWGSWLYPDKVVHPHSPSGAAGPGGFRQPGPLGMDGTPGSLPHPQSPGARWMDPQSIAAAYHKDRTDVAVADVTGASYWPQMKHFAEVILGPYSFGLGV